MLRTEVSTDKHPRTKCNGKREYILSLYHDSDKTPDEPKNGHCCRKSLCHEGRKLYKKSIDKIIPNAWPRDKKIPKNIQEKKTEIIKPLSSLRESRRWMKSYFLDKCSDREKYHTQCRDSIDECIRKWEYEICTQETSCDWYYRTRPEKSRGDIPTFMELIESPEDVPDLPELIGDTRHLRTHPDCGHQSDSEDRNSSRWKTPEIRWDESDKKKDENFEFFRHLWFFQESSYFSYHIFRRIILDKILCHKLQTRWYHRSFFINTENSLSISTRHTDLESIPCCWWRHFGDEKIDVSKCHFRVNFSSIMRKYPWIFREK